MVDETRVDEIVRGEPNVTLHRAAAHLRRAAALLRQVLRTHRPACICRFCMIADEEVFPDIRGVAYIARRGAEMVTRCCPSPAELDEVLAEYATPADQPAVVEGQS